MDLSIEDKFENSILKHYVTAMPSEHLNLLGILLLLLRQIHTVPQKQLCQCVLPEESKQQPGPRE